MIASRALACCSSSNSPAQIDAIADRQLDVLGDALLRLGDGAAEIAAAHAEFDRNEALVALVIDVGGAGIERDIGKLAQRNISVGAGRRLIADLDVADASMLSRYSGASRTVTLNCRSASRSVVADRAAERRLNDVVDVAGIEPVARRLVAIDLDVEIWLAEDAEDAEVGHALDLRHFLHAPPPAIFSSVARSRPMILTELAPLTPERPSSTLS